MNDAPINPKRKDLTITNHKTKSVRYQTKRSGEVKSRDSRGIKLMEELEEMLKTPSLFSDEDLDLYEKRYKSLCEKYKKNKPRNLEEQNHIPFRIDGKTLVWIREKNLYRTKWTTLIGIKNIKKRLKEYHELLPKKPKGMIYWNPFLD